MPLVHKHIIIRAEVNNPPSNPDWCIQWFRNLAEKIGMKICVGPISAYVDVPGNEGVTVAAVIETSHMAMHVWDAERPALIQMDVYTCGPINPQDVFDELQQFDPTKLEYKFLDREHGLIEIPITDE